MTYAIMLGVFVVLLFLGAPIALSLGMSSLLAILYNGTGIKAVPAADEDDDAEGDQAEVGDDFDHQLRPAAHLSREDRHVDQSALIAGAQRGTDHIRQYQQRDHDLLGPREVHVCLEDIAADNVHRCQRHTDGERDNDDPFFHRGQGSGKPFVGVLLHSVDHLSQKKFQLLCVRGKALPPASLYVAQAPGIFNKHFFPLSRYRRVVANF